MFDMTHMGFSPKSGVIAYLRTAQLTALFLLCGFYFLILSKPEYPRYWYDHQRLMELLIVTLSTVFMPFMPVCSERRLQRVFVLLGITLLAVLLIHGIALRPVLIESLILGLLVIVAVWWAGIISAVKLSDALLLSAQLSIAGYVATSLLWLAASLGSGMLPDPFAFFNGFVNPRLFGAWVTLSWPLLLLRPRLFDALAPALARWLLVLLFVLAALWWSLAFFSGTRATWLAAVAMLGLTALCSKAARRIALRGVLVIAAGYVLHQLLFVQIASWVTGLESVDALNRLREGVTLSNRDVLWRLAWQGIVERPWFGAGPMMFSATNNGIASTTHNIVLQLAYEWGVPFALVVIYATARALWRQFLRCRVETGLSTDPIRVVLWMCIVGALIEAQFDGLLSAPHSQLMFTVLCAWLMSLDPPVTAALSARRALAWPVVRFVPLAMALVLWWAVWPELSNLESWELQAWERTGAAHFQPRFWLQGVILPEP